MPPGKKLPKKSDASLSPKHRKELAEAVSVFTGLMLLSRRYSAASVQLHVQVILSFLNYTQRPLVEITPDAYLSWMSGLLTCTGYRPETIRFHQSAVHRFYEMLLTNPDYQQVLIKRHGFVPTSPVQPWLLRGVLWFRNCGSTKPQGDLP